MIDRERLFNKRKAYGIILSDDQLGLLDKYSDILVEYNSKVNLTAITDPEGIEDRHFIDSLLFRRREEVAGSVVDVGTGAGFPGIVTKIYKPQIEINLMDPLGKRCVFLQYALDSLGLKGNVIKERAEEAARKQYREKYDIATARAVADMRVLSEYCIPLVRVGGLFIAMKSSNLEEIELAKPAINKLGAEYLGAEDISLPDGSRRTLVFCRKTGNSPAAYPRNGGKIAKSPL